ncbi:MAG: NAD(P)/FAD-dependent oxidoreductase [Desulfobacteraceae bacterium]|nr:FAD-dependent oxidoreductase [Desulfobacteraceae bacterium]MBC2757447.1 NAD(P)/FAD-dependent oxidoreductase [Desulfobacteraceae bacterium]
MFNKHISRRSFLTISAMTAAALALDWKKVNAMAAKMGPPTDYPTVIIGAGLGGLCCGAYLARQGIPVTVIEQHYVPGGYATSFDRAAGKFTFEVSLHGTTAKNNSVERILKNIGVYDRLEFVELPDIYCMKTPDFEINVPQRNPDLYIQMLAEKFPEEADGIRSFVYEMIGITDEVDRLHQKKGKFFKPFFPLQYRKMWHVRNQTLADMLKEHVQNQALKDALAGLWGYYGLPSSQLSAFYYSVATGGYLKNGSYYIKQRSQDLSNAMAQEIENSGGKILYNKTVTNIRVKDNTVTGIEMSDKTTLAAKAVVSNASALTTFQKMLPKDTVPEAYLKQLKSYRPSISSFIVWLGLNQDITDRISCYGTHVSGKQDVETAYQSCINGDIENGPFGVAAYDKAFNGYSMPDTSTLMLLFLCGYEPWRQFESDYQNNRKKSYYTQKNQWTDILIRRAEETLIPGLSSMIEVKEAGTPLTNWQYTGNTEGAIYGFEQSMNNAFMNRISNESPINGLYLAGSWGDPGGGYEGALRSGEITFQKLMEKWGG